MKKTYIPSTPRSRKLKSVGGGTINVSGGSAQNVPVIEGHTHDNKIILDAITQLHLRILSSLNVDEDGALIVELSNIIKELDATVPTDENLFSALRTVLEIRARSISKTDPDTAQEIIKFVKGIEIGTFTTGPLGAGAAIKMENGVSRMEVDQLDVRMRATFRELIIESLKHIGGQLILSPARMKCNKVVDGGTYYKCYFDTGDGKVSNEFVAGDQARCQVFTGSGVKMYWRLVTSVGTDWINLSKTDAISGSSIPEAGDDIVQLGNRSDVTRQNAQILSTVGTDAPSWKQYKGINSFSLEGKDTTVFSGTGNKIDGKTVFTSNGANVEDGINSKNSNYSSQPTSYKANDTWTLSSDTTVNGIAYKAGEILTATQDSTAFVQAHWVKKVRYTDDTAVNNLQIGKNLFRNKNGRPLSLVGAGTTPPTIELVQMDTPFGNEAYKVTIPANNNTGYAGCRVQTNNIQLLPSTVYSYSTYVYIPDQNASGIYIYPTGSQGLPDLVRDTGKDIGQWLCYSRDGVTTPATTINDYMTYYANTVFSSPKIFYIAGVKFEQRDKTSFWVPNPEDVQAEINDAKQEALTAAGNAQTTANSLKDFTDTAFRDGIIDRSESVAIEKYKNSLNEAMSKAEASYNKVYLNTYLPEGAAKTSLLNAKINLWGQRDTLLSAINTAISGGITTPAQKTAVDNAFNTLNSLMLAFQSALEEANKAIQKKLDDISKGYVDNLEISSVNLLNNSCDFQTTGWNGGWGNNGGGYNIDNDILFNGKPTLRTMVGAGLVHSWLKLENNIDYTYCAMVRSNEDVSWASSSTPLHYHAGFNNQSQGNISVSKADTLTIANQWKLIYITFKLTGDADSFRPHFYRGSGTTIYNIAFFGLVKGTKPLLVATSSESDKQAKIDAAKQEALIAANNVQTNVNNLNTYVDGAFKNGIIEETEAKAIEKYLNTLSETKLTLDASYAQIDNNSYLEGTAKTNLASAKTAFNTAYTNLTNSIYTAIADGKTTAGEKNDVNNKFGLFNTALMTYQTRSEEASKAIQDKLKGYSDNAQNTANSAKLTAEQAQLQADGYMRARYVRDWAKGSTVNNDNHWSEVKIINKSGTNLANGKTPTTNGTSFLNPSIYATDNNISTHTYVADMGSPVYIQIDLGQIYYDIDYIQIWHYYADGRTYYDTKTEISTDGVNWTPVFDSAKSGTYKETAAGNIISFRPNEVLAKVLKGAAVTDTFKTTVNGGLISTVITEYRELNSEQITGLISGIQGANKNLPFLVAGGTYAEGIAGTAKAIIRHDGSSKFSDTEITGKFSSGASGNRIIIDPVKKEIEMLNAAGEPTMSIYFNDSGSIDYSQIRLRSILNGVFTRTGTFDSDGVTFSDSQYNFFAQFLSGLMQIIDQNNPNKKFAVQTDNGQSFLSVTMSGLTTNPALINSGQVYRDTSGNLKVKL